MVRDERFWYPPILKPVPEPAKPVVRPVLAVPKRMAERRQRSAVQKAEVRARHSLGLLVGASVAERQKAEQRQKNRDIVKRSHVRELREDFEDNSFLGAAAGVLDEFLSLFDGEEGGYNLCSSGELDPDFEWATFGRRRRRGDPRFLSGPFGG